jgi:hypothetical protein
LQRLEESNDGFEIARRQRGKQAAGLALYSSLHAGDFAHVRGHKSDQQAAGVGEVGAGFSVRGHGHAAQRANWNEVRIETSPMGFEA